MTIRGECFCGQIRYEINGSLHDARSCHCSRCRRAFSGAASAYAEVDSEQFIWVAGETLLTTYEATPGWGLCFCSVCGSTLCGIHQGKVHGVTLGTVTGDPDVQLKMHIFVGSKAPWDAIAAGVPQFEAGPPSP